MLAVTEQYKNTIYGITRETKSKIEFEIVDVDAYADATITVTSENSFSKKDQTVNLIRNLPGRYATFENDYWKLDGTFILPPKSSETGIEVGWWSSLLSGSDGTFSTPQVHTTNFGTTQNAIGITVTFDQQSNECAADFVIKIYDNSLALMYTDTVTGNTLSKYILEQNLSNFKRVTVTITKWATGYRRARITEVDFGIIKEYTDNEIIKLNVIEEVDPTSNTVTSNETKFTLDNQSQEFNILNPVGIYAYLQRKQKIKPYLGLVVTDTYTEYVPMGVYYLNEWKSDEGALTATFVARDILDLLQQSTYRKGIKQSRTLYNLAVDVLSDAGITDYVIDTALQSITSVGHIPIMTHKEALQLIANAGMAVVYSDRFGVIQIKQLDSVALSGEAIDFDNVYEKPKLELNKLINTVEVVVSNYVAKASSEKIYEGTIAITGTVNVWIEYKSGPAQSISSVITGGGVVVNSQTYYGSAALLNLTASGSVTITTTGTVLERSQSIYLTQDAEALAGEQPLGQKVDNELITSNALASSLGAYLLAEYQARFQYEIPWRQNQAYEAGDIVSVANEFGTNTDVRITKNEFNYSGYLGGKTGGRGGV